MWDGGGHWEPGFYGLADGAAVIMNETVDLTGGQEAILMLSDAVALGVTSAILLLPVQQIIQKIRPTWLVQPAWTLFLCAMAGSAMLDLAENWFTDPPPFTEAPPLHGNIAVFLGVSAALGASALLLGRWIPMGRPQADHIRDSMREFNGLVPIQSPFHGTTGGSEGQGPQCSIDYFGYHQCGPFRCLRK